MADTMFTPPPSSPPMTQDWDTYEQSDFERASKICEAFEGTQRAMWSSKWPFGHCAVSSLLLAPMLRAAMQVKFHVVIGYVKRMEFRVHRPGAHAWVEDEDGAIFDPTFGQFMPYSETALLTLQAHEARTLGHMPWLSLTLDGEEKMRRSIAPRSTHDGWIAGSHCIFYFKDVRKRIVDSHIDCD